MERSTRSARARPIEELERFAQSCRPATDDVITLLPAPALARSVL